MRPLVPTAPWPTAAELERQPAVAWVAPALLRERDYVRLRTGLPAGMPDCLEVRVTHLEEGVERVTSAVCGRNAYLIHYCFAGAQGRTY